MNKTLFIKYLHKGIIGNGSLYIEYIDKEIVLKYTNGSIDAEAKDIHPFIALTKIRKELESHGILMLCKGNRIDVYPSGGLLSGIGALQLTIGKKNDITHDLVKIFDEEDDITTLGTVEQQKEYFDNWLKSVRE